MRDAFLKGLCAAAEADPNVILITGDLGFGVLDEFRERFPRQFLNVGVAEQNMTGIACGMSLEGKKVFTYSIANFCSLRCLEQLRNDAAYHELNVNVVSIGAGFSYGALGVSHHATEDMSILRAIPNFTVLCPGDDWEAEQIALNISNISGPSYVRLDRSSAGVTSKDGEVFEFGKARRLYKGEDVLIVSTGGILSEVLVAAGRLTQMGISPSVLHYHTVKPFDCDSLIEIAKQTTAIVTVEEHSVVGGLGSIVAETILDAGVQIENFARVGIEDRFVSKIGSQEYLRRVHSLDSESITQRVASLFSKIGKQVNEARI